MTQIVIDIGAVPNDGTGDPLRTAFNDVNLNFANVFAAGPVDSNIQIVNNRILTVNTNGNLVLNPNGIGVVQANAHVVPDQYGIRNLGSSSKRWATVYTQYLDYQGANISYDNLAVPGNITAGGFISAVGNVTGDYIFGNGGQLTGLPSAVGNNGAVQINWLGTFSNQGGTPGDTYSTLQFDGNGMPTLDGTTAYQQRTDYSPYLQVLAPRVESTDFGIIAGPGVTVVGYDDNYNTPRSAYMSVQDQATATQQWDFGILGYGNNNYSISDRTGGNAWTFGTDGNITLPSNVASINYANGNPYGGGGGSYGNSSVATFLADFGSNTISTTGNVSAGNVSTSDQVIANGEIQSGTGFFTGGYLSVNGSTDLHNANVTGDLSVTGNITSNTIVGNGNLHLEPDPANPGSYLDIFLTSGPDLHLVASAAANLILGKDAGANVMTSWNGNVYIQSWTRDFPTHVGGVWTFGYDGNLTLPGNTFAVNYANGDPVIIGSSTANTGNVTFSDQIVIGTGISNLVSGLYLAPSSSSANAVQYLRVRGDVSYEPTHIHFDTGNNQYFNQFIGDDNKYVLLSNTGNIVINTDDYVGNSAQWTFGTNGSTIFPTLTVQRGDNPSGTITGQTLLFGDATQEAIISTPNGTSGNEYSQRLVINPGQGYDYGEGGDIYLWAGRGGDGSGSGGDIKIRGGQGGASTTGGTGGDGGYIRIEAGDSATTGGAPGYIDINAGINYLGAGGYVDIQGGQGHTIGGDAKITGGYGYNVRGGNVNIWGGGSANGQSNEGHVNIQTGGNTWTFDPSGNLTVPGGGAVFSIGTGTVGITANATSTIGNAYLGLDDTSSAATLYGNAGVQIGTNANVSWNFQPSGNLTAPGNISAVGNVTGGNILTGGLISATGNVRGGNINTTGLVTATGNVYGNYFVGNGSQLTNITVSGSNPVSTTGNVAGGNLIATGTVSATGNITANYFFGNVALANGFPATYGNSNVATFLAGFGSNTVSTTGNITSGNAIILGNSSTGVYALDIGATATFLSNTVASFTANVNNYTQTTLQNLNTGADATADFVITANNGNDTVNYSDFGIINSGYDNATPTNSLGNIVFAADTYLYAQGNTGNASQSGGNLAIGTTVPGKNVKIFAGGITNSAIVANIGNTGVAVTGTVSATGNITTAGNFIGNGAALTNVTVSVAGNIVGTSSNVGIVAGSYTWTFNNTGNLTLPGNTFAVNYANNTPVNVVTKFEGTWTVPTGNSTQSFTVSPSETYYMWVDCNIPNGILTWNATATITNTNVPVVGAQYAWVYNGGGTPIDFTSIPNQFIGTSNTIVRSSTAPSATTNKFDFGINNTSGNSQTVRYGWIQISY